MTRCVRLMQLILTQSKLDWFAETELCKFIHETTDQTSGLWPCLLGFQVSSSSHHKGLCHSFLQFKFSAVSAYAPHIFGSLASQGLISRAHIFIEGRSNRPNSWAANDFRLHCQGEQINIGLRKSKGILNTRSVTRQHGEQRQDPVEIISERWASSPPPPEVNRPPPCGTSPQWRRSGLAGLDQTPQCETWDLTVRVGA